MPSLPTGTVTFLLTYIEGSTRLLQQIGDAYAGRPRTRSAGGVPDSSRYRLNRFSAEYQSKDNQSHSHDHRGPESRSCEGENGPLST
jgi:hypothetical protein